MFAGGEVAEYSTSPTSARQAVAQQQRRAFREFTTPRGITGDCEGLAVTNTGQAIAFDPRYPTVRPGSAGGWFPSETAARTKSLSTGLLRWFPTFRAPGILAPPSTGNSCATTLS
jgi:hypothetical protein